MADVFNLSDERNRRAAPDADFIRKDDFGRPLYCFTCSYEHDGGQWVQEVWAYSLEDAEAKVASMRASLRVDGQVYSALPA